MHSVVAMPRGQKKQACSLRVKTFLSQQSSETLLPVKHHLRHNTRAAESEESSLTSRCRVVSSERFQSSSHGILQERSSFSYSILICQEFPLLGCRTQHAIADTS